MVLNRKNDPNTTAATRGKGKRSPTHVDVRGCLLAGVGGGYGWLYESLEGVA